MPNLIKVKDTEEFINLSKNKFPNKYTYENTTYRGEFRNIIIYCKNHNEKVNVKPYFHLNASIGCMKCKKQK